MIDTEEYKAGFIDGIMRKFPPMYSSHEYYLGFKMAVAHRVKAIQVQIDNMISARGQE